MSRGGYIVDEDPPSLFLFNDSPSLQLTSQAHEDPGEVIITTSIASIRCANDGRQRQLLNELYTISARRIW